MVLSLPCKNCITYAICRSKYHKILNSDLAEIVNPTATNRVTKLNIRGYARYMIGRECSLLTTYLYKYSTYKVFYIEKPIPIYASFKLLHISILKKFRNRQFDRYMNKDISK